MVTDVVPFGGDDVQWSSMEAAGVVVLPLCYENAISYGGGCGKGPLHLLEASVQLERMDEEALVDWGLKKIFTCPPVYPPRNAEKAVEQMRQLAAPVMARAQFLLSIGGDHAVAIGPIMAAAEKFPDIGVLQVDAHLDLRHEWNGSRYNHACVMRRVVEDLHLPAVQVGIRSFSPEEADVVRKAGLKPFYAHRLDASDDRWIGEVVDALPDTVYLTIDLDGLDPSVIPGTGTPEPGGLTYRQLVKLIQRLGSARKVVAADITELAKIEGTQVSEFTAARIAAKIIVYCQP